MPREVGCSFLKQYVKLSFKMNIVLHYLTEIFSKVQIRGRKRKKIASLQALNYFKNLHKNEKYILAPSEPMCAIDKVPLGRPLLWCPLRFLSSFLIHTSSL